MKTCQITKGGFYKAKVSNRVVTVRVDSISTTRAGYGREGTHYCVTNMVTGRTTSFRSARRFIRAAVDPAVERVETQKALAAGAEDLGSSLGYHDPFKLTPDEKLGNRTTAERVLDSLMGGDWHI